MKCFNDSYPADLFRALHCLATSICYVVYAAACLLSFVAVDRNDSIPIFPSGGEI